MSTDTISKPSLTLTRRFDAAPARVFSAWTDPEKITRWFGPEKVKVVNAESDPRVGGRYRIVARGPDGEEHASAASIAKWCRIRNLSSPGPGDPHRNASPW